MRIANSPSPTCPSALIPLRLPSLGTSVSTTLRSLSGHPRSPRRVPKLSRTPPNLAQFHTHPCSFSLYPLCSKKKKICIRHSFRLCPRPRWSTASPVALARAGLYFPLQGSPGQEAKTRVPGAFECLFLCEATAMNQSK